MSRIDVVGSDGKFRVLFNYCQHGVELKSSKLANQTATKLKAEHYPAAELHLAEEKEEK